MSVFDEIARTRRDVPHQDEPQFSYLNVSGRPEAERVRGLIEDWVRRYPEKHRRSLISRLRSPIDDEHRSAFYELFLHELLYARGHKVIEIEPTLPHTNKKPVFLVATAEGTKFYLEAVLATGRSAQEAGAVKRLNQALRAIDTFPSPDHVLDLRIHGVPGQPTSINKLKAALKAWVVTLSKGAQSKTPFLYEEYGVQIRLDAWPKNRPREGRAIGVRHFPVQQVSADEDLRAAVIKKANRYGKFDLPYLVAVNSSGIFLEESSVMDALLGTQYTAAYHKNGAYVYEDRRHPDGVWNAPDGPERRGVSAVLATREITPWNFAARMGLLVFNPWATHPLPEVSLGVEVLKPTKVWKKTPGEPMGKLFGLPDGWPVD